MSEDHQAILHTLIIHKDEDHGSEGGGGVITQHNLEGHRISFVHTPTVGQQMKNMMFVSIRHNMKFG